MTIPAESPTPPPSPTGEVIVSVFGRTDVGRTREHNEDAFLVVDLTTDNASLQPEVRVHTVGPRGTLFMVADGLGGAAAGEIASEIAVNTVHKELRERWMKSDRTDPEAFAAAIKAAAEVTNTRIFTYALEHPEYRGLGTTATIAGLLHDTLYVAQVGDSRAYIVRDGVAQQITKDQSLMQRLIEAGELTPDEAERSERRNIILQALGPEPSVRIDLTYQRLRRGDTLILCTDGLSGLVRKEEIAEVVASESDLAEICRELIDRANENGGPDNITVIAARFDGSGLSGVGPDDRVGHTVYPLPGSDTPTEPQPHYERGSRWSLGGRHANGAAPLESTQVLPRSSPPAPTPTPRPTPVWVYVLIVALAILAGVVLAAHRWRQSASSTPAAAPRDTVAPAGASAHSP